jgi:hypothetical protein
MQAKSQHSCMLRVANRWQLSTRKPTSQAVDGECRRHSERADASVIVLSVAMDLAKPHRHVQYLRRALLDLPTEGIEAEAS